MKDKDEYNKRYEELFDDVLDTLDITPESEAYDEYKVVSQYLEKEQVL